VEEEAAEVEPEDQEAVEVSERMSGPHSPSSEDLSKTERSLPSKRSTPSPSQSRNTKLLINSSPTLSTSFPMRLCAFFQFKSKPRPVKEPDSRLLLLAEIDKVTLVLVSSALRKSKLPSRVLSLTPSAT